MIEQARSTQMARSKISGQEEGHNGAGPVIQVGAGKEERVQGGKR